MLWLAFDFTRKSVSHRTHPSRRPVVTSITCSEEPPDIFRSFTIGVVYFTAACLGGPDPCAVPHPH